MLTYYFNNNQQEAKLDIDTAQDLLTLTFNNFLDYYQIMIDIAFEKLIKDKDCYQKQTNVDTDYKDIILTGNDSLEFKKSLIKMVKKEFKSLFWQYLMT